jgi:hypothetical protein
LCESVSLERIDLVSNEANNRPHVSPVSLIGWCVATAGVQSGRRRDDGPGGGFNEFAPAYPLPWHFRCVHLVCCAHLARPFSTGYPLSPAAMQFVV